MDIGADIFIGVTMPPDMLRAAAARVFNVPVDRVAIRHLGEPWPDADVLFESLNDTPNPGDYPLQLLPWVPDDRVDDPSTISALAHELGVPILTAADSYDPADQELHLPDGSMYRVSVLQDDDGGIRNTPIMRRLIAEHSPAIVIAS